MEEESIKMKGSKVSTVRFLDFCFVFCIFIYYHLFRALCIRYPAQSSWVGGEKSQSAPTSI